MPTAHTAQGERGKVRIKNKMQPVFCEKCGLILLNDYQILLAYNNILLDYYHILLDCNNIQLIYNQILLDYDNILLTYNHILLYYYNIRLDIKTMRRDMDRE